MSRGGVGSCGLTPLPAFVDKPASYTPESVGSLQNRHNIATLDIVDWIAFVIDRVRYAA